MTSERDGELQGMELNAGSASHLVPLLPSALGPVGKHCPPGSVTPLTHPWAVYCEIEIFFLSEQ